MTEWCLVALILLGIGFAFEREIRSLQAQSEKVFVLSTVASLRTALILNSLSRQLRPDDQSLVERNPFRLLEQLPPSLAGEMPMREVYRVAPGSWLFDPDCLCVGYRLQYPDGLKPVQEVGAIWFRVGKNGAVPTLTPLTEYLWLGTPLK